MPRCLFALLPQRFAGSLPYSTFAGMTIQQAQQQLRVQLQSIYDPREAGNIANWVMESVTGLERMDRLLRQYDPLSPHQEATLATYTTALLEHLPVQYVLHEAWFYGLKLYVDEQVLIPRPETEELVEWVVEEWRIQNSEYRIQDTALGIQHTEDKKHHPIILDIGTGSGCIPIALKKRLPAATVYGCDVSEGALQVAQRNAAALDTQVQFFLLDFLQADQRATLPPVDILVSNPPYIPVKDKATMHANVLAHEPHLALFVENDDPLLFYRHIAAFANTHLLPGGAIYVEIHEDLGPATVQLFQEHGFNEVLLKKDMQGKDRMIRAMKIA